MAASFNLTAQLNLRGPSNIRNIVSNIRRQLGTINGNINFNIDPTTVRNVAQLNTALQGLNQTFAQTANAARNASNAVAAFSASAGNINAVATNINNVGTATNSATQSIAGASRQTAVARTEMEEFGRQSALAIRRFAAFSLSTGAILGVVSSIKQALGAFIEYDKQLVRLQQVTGETANGLSRLSTTITSLSTGFGVSSNELINVSSTLAQAGLSARDTERALKALALSSLAPSFDNMNKTVEGSIALMRQFGIAAKDLEPALGSINAVAAAFAVESGDIIAAIQRTGGVFSAASKGVSEGKDALNEFIAVFTSVRATTRESAETIATGLRTIFTRIQRGSTIEALKEFGVTLTDAEGKFVGTYKAIELLSRGLNTIDPRDLKFSKIVEELGGFRQIGKVIPLIQQFQTAQQALAVAQAGTGSLAKDAATAQLSLGNQITKVKEEFLALFREIGASDSFQTITRGALDVASALIRVADSVKGVLPILGIMLAMKGASAITQFGAGFLGGVRRGGGGPRGFARGGVVPGSGRGDKVPALLEPGEVVMSNTAVNRYGRGNLVRMNQYARGGSVPVQPFNNGGVVQKFAKGKGVKESKQGREELSSSGPTEFTHISTRIDPTQFSPQLQKYFKSKKLNVSGLYTNMGLDLPVSWNRNWAQPKDNKGAFAQTLGSYIQSKDVFKTLKSGSNKRWRFTGRGDSIPQELLIQSADQIRSRLAKGVNGLSNFFDIDPEVSNVLPRLLKSSIQSVLPRASAKNLISGFEEASAYKVGSLRKPATKQIRANIKNLGGPIQKFMVGGLSKEAKPKTISPADLLVGPGGIDRAIWATITKQALAAKQLTLSANNRNIVFPTGKEIDFKKALDANPNAAVRDALAGAGLQPGELRKKFTDLYTKQRAGVIEAKRTRSPDEVMAAQQKSLLFGAAGMYGNRFSPAEIVFGTSDGLKQETRATVFGSLLDRNVQEKEKRLQKRKIMLGAAGVPGGSDAGSVEIESAPTARGLSKKFKSTGVSKANKAQAIDRVGAIAKTLSPQTQGSQIFLDFDRTLTFGADKIGPKLNKKAPDYSAFGDPKQVSDGLAKAKLSRLGIRLKKLVTDLDLKSSGLGNELLKRMFVVSARPPKTMSLISKWLAAKGLRIPAGNISGVGGPGLGADGVAIAKAEKILNMAGSGSVFIDDDSRNIAAAREKGISSIQYGSSGTEKSRRQNAQQEGLQFEQFINEQLPVGLKAGILGPDKEGMDFPLGLGNKISQYWFNDPRLSSIPVDTKRTLSGPRGKIKQNILSYLKQQGYNSGGMVQKMAEGSYARGKKGAKGARGPKGFKPLGDVEYQKWANSIYDRYDKDPSLPWSSHMDIPMPPEIADYHKKVSRYALETGGAGLAIGKDAKGFEVIAKFARAKAQKAIASGKLKKTQGALTFSAAGLERGPKAPAGQMEKTLAQYQKDPQYRTAMGLDSGVAGGFLKQFETLSKAKNFTSPKSLLDKLPGAKSKISEFRSSLQQQLKTSKDPKEIKSLQDQIKKSTTALDDFDSYMMGGSPRNAGRASHFAWAMRQAVPDAARFAQGGLAEAAPQMKGLMGGLYSNRGRSQDQTKDQTKKQKDFGKIALRTGNRIQATYIKDAASTSTRSGQVIADKAGANLFSVQSSAATKGYGPKLYDIVMEAATAQGSMLTSDRRTVSPSAKSVWDYYFSRRGDVSKVPLDPVDWTSNSRLIDPKLYGRPETWPPKNDPAWILQTGYKKAPADINNTQLVQKLSRGGSSKDTVDAMVSSGEAYIPPKLAQKIGRSKLDKMNQADKNGISGFSNGGISVFQGPGSGTSDSIRTRLPVGAYILREKATKALGLSKGGSVGGVRKFAVGGAVDTAVAAMSPKDANRLKASIAKNARAFEQLERLVTGFPIDEVQMSLKSLARSLDKGVTTADALDKAILITGGAPKPGAPKKPGAVREAPKDRVGTAGRPADMGTSKIFTNRANFEANKAKTIVDIQAYEKSEYDKARKQGSTAQEARQSSKAAAITRSTQLAQPMSKKQEQLTVAQARGRSKESGASDDDAQRAGQNALNKAKAKKQAQRQAAAIFNTASITGDQTSLRNTLNATPPPKRSDTVSKFGSFGAGRLDAAQSFRNMSANAAAARAPASASSFSALAGKDKAGLGDALGVLANKIKNLNLSAIQKFGSVMATVNTKLAGVGQTVTSLRSSFGGAGSSLKQFIQTSRQNPFKAIAQATSGVSGILKKMTAAVSTATGSLTTFGRRAAAAPSPGGGAPEDGGGGRGGMGGRLQSAAFGLSFALPMIADMMTVAEPKTSAQAGSNAQMTGISTAVGSATMLASMGGLGAVAAIPVAVGGIIKAFADAKNAAHEFNKQAQSTKLEESLEKAGTALDHYSKNVGDVAASEKARASVIKANQEARTLSTMQQEPKASMVSLIFENSSVQNALGTTSPENTAMQRSQILEQKGIMSYLSSVGATGGDAAASTAGEFRSLIPQLAKENAKTFQGAAEASSRFLETQFKSGKTVEDMSASGELNEFGRSLALADIKVQEYMMAVDNTLGLSDAQKNSMKENIIATQAEAKAREIQTRALREKALESLNRQTTQLQNSLERTFQNMEQAINSNAYSLVKLGDSAELTAASLSGAARAGAVRVDAINALNNPRGVDGQQRNAAITQAASMFGSQAPEMEGVLKLSGILEDTLMSTINNTIKASNASGVQLTEEAMGAKLESSINQSLADLKLPPELATGLSREVKNAIAKMRTSSGEDQQLDFSEIAEQVPQLGRVLASARRAQEVANKALEYWQENLNQYANAMNGLVDTQVEINTRLRRSADILISSQLSLGKALGQAPSLQASVAVINQKRASQTSDGLTNPRDIERNVRNLEATRATQEAQSQEAAQKGFSGKDEFKNMQNNLANTNLALRENYASLKDMAENTDKANVAMERISELRARTQAGAGIAERLVTSSPQELASLNRSMAMLNNNMSGGMNIGSTAEDRKGTLDVFNMIAPFLGDRQDGLKANVLESMLRESGVGVNNMMQGVLDSLRAPEGDPQMAEAIRIYQEGVREQVLANTALANLAKIMNENNAEVAAKKLGEAITGLELKFETQLLTEINTGIQNLVGIAQQKPPGNVAGAVGIAKGGVVYAAEGQHINFKTKGTDTVPAMLTPGEFVVNRSATQKNLPLLQNINNGYQKGGKVSYYNNGGLVFGGRWGLRSRDRAQAEIEGGSEMESKSKLGGFNWSSILEKGPIGYSSKTIPRNNKLLSLGKLPYYAGNSASKKNIDSVLLNNENSSGSIPGAQWFPGRYPESFTMETKDRTGGIELWLTDIEQRIKGGDVSQLDIPNLDWATKAINSPQNFSFDPNTGSKLSETLFQTLKQFPATIKKDTNSVSINGQKLLFSKAGSADSIGPADPSYDVKYDKSENKHTLKVSNLAAGDRSDKRYLTDEVAYQSSLKGVSRNLTTNTPLFGQMYKGFTKFGFGSLFGGRPTLDIGSRDSLGMAAKSYYDQVMNSRWNPSELNLQGISSNPDQQFEDLIRLKEAIKNAYDTVVYAKAGDFQESQNSLNRKVMISKMQNLVRGSSFKETFDPTEIAGGVPTTLFNLPEDIWSTLFPKFTNSPANSYAANKNTWAPIGEMDDMGRYASLGKLFPWIREGFSGDDLDKIMTRKKEFIEQVGDLVKQQPKDYVGPNAEFSYKEIVGPAWDKARGTFTKDKYKFNIIDNFAGDKNPFQDIQLDRNTEAILGGTQMNPADINAFMRTMAQQSNNTGKLSPFVALKLSKIDPALKGDYSDNTKDSAFYNLFSRTEEFEPIKYKKNLDKTRENQRIDRREDVLGQAAGAAVEANNFDAGKRVALGRLVFDVARKGSSGSPDPKGKKLGIAKVPIRSRPPEDIDHLPHIAQALHEVVQTSPSDYIRTAAAGTKTIFDKLSDIGEDGSFFLSNGIDINNAFDPKNAKRKKIRLNDGTFTDAIYDYKNLSSVIDSNKIVELIRNTGMQARLASDPGAGGQGGANVGGLLNQRIENRDKFGLSLQGIEVMEADPKTGELKAKPFTKVVQDDSLKLKDLFDLSFNPYTQFPDNLSRKSLFNIFQTKFNKAVMPGTRRPAFDKRLLSFMNQEIEKLANWYSAQDFFINTSDSADKITQKQTRLTSTGQQSVDRDRVSAQKANLFYTNNQFGELPTYEWMLAKLDQKINPADAKVQDAVGKATGGMIYASNGALINFQPKGTDTVPAMLTPGEFVVNRESTKRNLPLLKNINMSTGGIVQYRAKGGEAYDTSTGTFSRSENLADQILSRVDSGNKVNELAYNSTNKNLDISKNTNSLSKNIDNTTSRMRSSIKSATGFSTGGPVYASEGALINFQPKGTDTVPAMLTPGEFVVNRAATQKNLPLLKSINSGVGGYSRGGVIYAAEGMEVPRRLSYDPNFNPEMLSEKEFKKRIESTKEIAKWISTTIIDSQIGGKIGGRFLSKQFPGVGLPLSIASGAIDEYKKGGNIFKGALLGALTGDSTTGSIASGLFGVEAGSIADKTMGMIGAMVNGGLTGAGLGAAGGIAALPAALIGIFVAGAAEFYKIVAEQQKLNAAKNQYIGTIGNSRKEGLAASRTQDETKPRRPFIYDENKKALDPAQISFERGLSQRIQYIREAASPTEAHYQQIFDRKGVFRGYDKNRDRILDETGERFDETKWAKEFEDSVIRARKYLEEKGINYKSNGGPVYASKGKLINFQPKGTDTVPAMLTPGEFVVNRAATQQNLPLLRSINNGGIKGYSRGGVAYLAEGGVGETDVQKAERLNNEYKTAVEASQIHPKIKELLLGVRNNIEKYDIFNTNAITEAFNNDNKYSNKISTLEEPEFTQEYQKATARFNYLAAIYAENSQHVLELERKYKKPLEKAESMAQGIGLVQGKGLVDIFTTQLTNAKLEGTAIKEAWDAEEAQRSVRRRRNGQRGVPQPLNRGGVVYANNGLLIPKKSFGSDTVPAMLTPGEFVINREATQKHLSLLHAINNNNFSQDSVLTMNKGGYIQPSYLSGGGVAGSSSLAVLPELLSKIAGGMQKAVEKAIVQAFNNIELPSSNSNTGVSNNKQIANQIGSFADNLSNLASRLESISVPPEITIQGRQDININANGLQVLSSLNPSLQRIALNMVKTAIDNLATKNPGTLDFNIDYPKGQ